MKKSKILIIEDDVFIRDIYQIKFAQEGFDVVVAENGVVAIEKMEQNINPDIILLDVIMPRMDGIEVLKKIKAKDNWSKIPIIMLSNISEKEKIIEGKSRGVNEYLIKSNFTPSEVVEKVNILLYE